MGDAVSKNDPARSCHFRDVSGGAGDRRICEGTEIERFNYDNRKRNEQDTRGTFRHRPRFARVFK